MVIQLQPEQLVQPTDTTHHSEKVGGGVDRGEDRKI